MPSQAISEGGLAKGVGNSSGGRGVSVGVVAAGICVDVAAEDEIVAVNVGGSMVGDSRTCCAANSCTGAVVAISSRRMDVLCAAQAVTKKRVRMDMILRI